MTEKQELILYLSQCLTAERLAKIDKVLNNRTRYLTIAMENIYQSQNASAVLRTCDCLGIQDIHIIENSNKYQINPDVALGAEKWLSLFKYNKKDENNSLSAIQNLRKKGYRIVATSSHAKSKGLSEFNIDNGKAAIFFGTELTGLSDTVMKEADELLCIPMYGFTESFNLSVSAGIILNILTDKLRTRNINWQLKEEEKDDLKIEWLTGNITQGDLMVKRFYEERKKRNKY